MKDIICQCGDIIQPNDDALCGNCALEFHANKRTIESLKRELQAFKKALEMAQAETLLLQADNRHLVEHMNAMALKPKSAYQVGDFVVCTYYRSPLPQRNSYERVIEVSGNGIVTEANDGCVTEYDINGNHGDINGWHIERLVKPEEYIICIGCLSGTVEPVSNNGIHLWFHLIGINHKTIATIRIESLDTRTRELVEGLLKAQEEEE